MSLHPSPIHLRDDDGGNHGDCALHGGDVPHYDGDLHDYDDNTIRYFLYNSCFPSPFSCSHLNRYCMNNMDLVGSLYNKDNPSNTDNHIRHNQTQG
ncbi:hypothetical protein BCE_0695 [Bacillus cereus ATCC 10987]|uniref:Uncharacterized protein n=1 Tax=Bacillus cereus (strain ATCC 10987 / NRS 248) TaxID=222523 RepID=Q73DL7_BACC1|nr:hypothetical protein BCE_0695 [Bacillus cereus ATCC 10987]